MFIRESGDWKPYRTRFGLTGVDELDLHFGRRREGSYCDAMADVEARLLEALRRQYERCRPYLLILHGWSTSRPTATTARSVVRGVMRSPAATPFINRPRCIQHESVFVAAIRDRA